MVLCRAITLVKIVEVRVFCSDDKFIMYIGKDAGNKI